MRVHWQSVGERRKSAIPSQEERTIAQGAVRKLWVRWPLDACNGSIEDLGHVAGDVVESASIDVGAIEGERHRWRRGRKEGAKMLCWRLAPTMRCFQ